MSETTEPAASSIPPEHLASFSQGRLTATPQRTADAARLIEGLAPIGLGDPRDGLLWTPAGLASDQPVPLALMLHGAGGAAAQMIDTLSASPSWQRVLLLAPESRGRTWDVIAGGYGPDVAFINAAIAHVAKRQALDLTHLAIGGFSDGGSYALSLGLTNGDLFSHIVAFSPGFLAPARQVGHPACFVSHGTRDAVLPITRCSRLLVPELQRAGYPVIYREFDGPHTVPRSIADEAVSWFLNPA